jgi:xylulokinase
MTFIGVDLGTSAVKAILVDDAQTTLARAERTLTVERPRAGWSEQDPDVWARETLTAFEALRAEAPAAFRACRAIGLAGHMHGAVALDARDVPLRPCILWDDGRAFAECAEMEARKPDLWSLAGNRAAPGFTAPKIAWMRAHEPELFARLRRVLLPKAYLRLVLTGEAVEEMSDASGTLWLDVGARDWDEGLLALSGLSREATPRLVEGSAAAARMRPELAAALGFQTPPLFAGGAGDNAAGAVGLGAVAPGDSFLSLGTSGVLWRTTAGFEPRAQAAAHAFCHALPGLWHQMSVHLSAASCLAWWARIAGASEAQLLAEAEPRAERPAGPSFAPYLAGERTPHNDPRLRAAFLGLGHASTRAELTQAVLEGVAFAFADGKDALEAGGPPILEAAAIGGGARSSLWLSILADVLNMSLTRAQGAETGGAFGAARLARLAATGETPAEAATKPAGPLEVFAPDPERAAAYRARRAAWRAAALDAARAAAP